MFFPRTLTAIIHYLLTNRTISCLLCYISCSAKVAVFLLILEKNQQTGRNPVPGAVRHAAARSRSICPDEAETPEAA